MIKKYSIFFKSIGWMFTLAFLFLTIQSIIQFKILGAMNDLFKQLSLRELLLIFQQFISHFSVMNIINTLFLVALLFFCIYCFKWILDQGAFYTFEYSWQKTKRYVLFFLPKYWPTKENHSQKTDYDEETGQRIFHTFEEFYEYKQNTKWTDINQLLLSSITLVVVTMMLSFILI